jgi:hypothetical protein
VRQECSLFATFFDIYIGHTLRVLKSRVNLGGKLRKDAIISNLLYAGDIVIILQESENNLHTIMVELHT